MTRVALLTREFPPEVYGGAGVHVEYLARELSRLVNARVYCFGKPRTSELVAAAYEPWDAVQGKARHQAALEALSVDLLMASGVEGADLVHSHTWYANFAGHLAKLLYGIPHVMTTHSLEPLRPWKAEQLGGGYAVSSFCERTAVEAADAVIAVSDEMRRDVLACYPDVDPAKVHVIHNGIDADEYRPEPGTEALERHGVRPDEPTVIFVGRITRQKGVPRLLKALRLLESPAQVVLCAGAPDTPEIGAEVAQLVAELIEHRPGVVWIEQMMPRPELVQLLSHASVFVCPSVYEPFGLVNLEAMACGIPVVATRTGGIPEIVVDGETGYLVEPSEEGFAATLARAIDRVLADPDRARKMGDAGRARVIERFSWRRIAEQTADLYSTVRGR